MRSAPLWIVALMLSGGCLRLGYDDRRSRPPDANQHDAGMDSGMDAAAQLDASMPGVRARDADVLVTMSDAAQDAAASPSDAGIDAAASPSDAALPDAQEPLDATSPDAAAEGGVADPCFGRSDLLYCSGLEDPALPGWGVATENNATLTSTAALRRSGSLCLHAAIDAAASGALIARREIDVFGHQASGDVWARAYFYVPSASVIDAASSIATLRISGIESPSFGCSVVMGPDVVELGGVATAFRASASFPRDRWTCVELHILIDASAGICEAYIDSTLAAQSPHVNTVTTNGYTGLSVGFSFSNAAQGPFDLYIDDVAADSARIGCD